MKNRGLKKIWGHNWDYYYLLRLEQRKISEMARDFAKWRHHVGWDRTVAEMKLCVKLLDIVLEKDSAYKSWLNTNYGEKGKFTPFHVHVNIVNYKRFMKQLDDFPTNPILHESLKIELRKKKALNLYHKIRTQRILTWWD
jgi:hypothetical protein